MSSGAGPDGDRCAQCGVGEIVGWVGAVDVCVQPGLGSGHRVKRLVRSRGVGRGSRRIAVALVEIDGSEVVDVEQMTPGRSVRPEWTIDCNFLAPRVRGEHPESGHEIVLIAEAL